MPSVALIAIAIESKLKITFLFFTVKWNIRKVTSAITTYIDTIIPTITPAPRLLLPFFVNNLLL